MKYSPHPYQQRAIKFMIDRPCAGLFMDPGLGKTSCSLAAITILLNKQFIKHALVIAPLRVIYSVWPQEIEKWDEFRHLDVGILHGPKKNKVLDEDHDIYLMNYDGLLWLRDTKRHKEFDLLLADECFVAGTQVSTLRGDLPIENVVVGDYVQTNEGWRLVEDTFEGCASATVVVALSNGKTFECTPNHEIWTQEEGWVAACNLSDHTLVDVPKLWGSVPSVPPYTREAANILLMEVRWFGEAWAPKLERWCTDARRVAQKVIRLFTEDGAQAIRAWRQWAWPDRVRTTGVECATQGLGLWVCGTHGRWETDTLQIGSGACGRPALHRGGWRIAQSARASCTRSSQRNLVAGPRVESVSRIERRGTIPVFDLQISGAHEYVVAGVRVHNSTKLKHTNTRRFKAMRSMVGDFDRRYILTGTPAPNGLMDLFGQVFVLDGGESLGKYVSHYRSQYFEQKPGTYDWTPRENAKEQIYERITPLVLRLDQKDYLDMPHQKVTDIWVHMPAKEQALYEEFEAKFVAQLRAGEIVATNAAVASSKLRQMASGAVYVAQEDGTRKTEIVHTAKLEACGDLVEQFQGQPTIIAYNFEHELEALQRQFGANMPFIGGGVKPKQALQLEAQWNQGQLPVFGLHSASAAHGLNLQHGGCHCIWYSLTWDLEQYDQLIRRVWRQGQNRNVVFIYHLLTHGTIDGLILKRLASKDASQRSLLDALREYYLTENEIKM